MHLDVAVSLREEVLRLLAPVGVRVVEESAGATAALVLAERELARDRTDALLRDGTPHLVGAAHAGAQPHKPEGFNPRRNKAVSSP